MNFNEGKFWNWKGWQFSEEATILLASNNDRQIRTLRSTSLQSFREAGRFFWTHEK